MLDHRTKFAITASVIRYATTLRHAHMPVALLVALVMVAFAARSSATQVQSQVTSLSRAVVSASSPGELIVTFDATGDIRGHVTLRLEVDANAMVTGGEWALVARYVQDLNADGSEATEPPHHEEGQPHSEYIVFVDKGTIGGVVTGGAIGTGSNGAPSLSVQLELSSGTLSFEGITAGSGIADADLGLADAQGQLRLSF